MALKMTLDSLEGLSKEMAALYTKGDDGKYTLGVEGLPSNDTTALKKALEAERAEKASLKEKWDKYEAETKVAQAKAAKEAEELARKNGDIAAIEKSWKEKMTAREKELKDQVSAEHKALEAVTVDAKATELAAKLFGPQAPILTGNIRSRLRMETVEGKPTIRVLDESGQPSAMTMAELEKSFVDNPLYKPLIVAGRGSGSGANGSNAGGGSGAGNKSITREAFDKLSLSERHAFYKNGGHIS